MLTEFSEPQRQSSKGIVVIFAFRAFKLFKEFFFIFLGLGISLSRGSVSEHIHPSLIALAVVILLMSILVFAILKYLHFKFYITKDAFHLNTGIINKESHVIPKSKIQNVYIKQNVLQQLIQVVSLKIETAGDSKSEIEIAALNEVVAKQIKEQLFQKPLNEVDNTKTHLEQGVAFFSVSPKRLLLEGLTQNHLKSFAIMVSFVMGSYYQLQSNLQDLSISQRANELSIEDMSTAITLVLLLIVSVLAVLLSGLFSIARTFIVNFNLKLFEKDHTFEIHKGLLNKISLRLAPQRIQNMVIKTNPLKRYFNLHTLTVKQAMLNTKQQKALSIVALEKDQLMHILQHLMPAYEIPKVTNKPNAFFKRMLSVRALIALIILNTPVLFVGGSFLWMNLFFISLLVLYVQQTYKKAYYSINDQFITVGSGFIDTTQNILEIHKIQSLRLKQTIFQRRRKVASLLIYTASKEVLIPYIDKNEAFYIYNYLLFKVESLNRDWM